MLLLKIKLCNNWHMAVSYTTQPLGRYCSLKFVTFGFEIDVIAAYVIADC